MRVEREAIIGIGVAVLVGLVLAALWYGALRPALFTPPSSEEVVEAFKEEGLEVGTYYDVDDEGEGQSPVPQTYVEGTRFTIPSLKEIDPIPLPPEPVLPGPDGRPVAGGATAPELPASPGDEGGRVFTFESQEDLDAVRDYYEGLGSISGWLDSHIYTEGYVLLQISGELPEGQAKESERVLRRVA
jgi:hypothetical protein